MRYKQGKGERRVTQADFRAAGRAFVKDVVAGLEKLDGLQPPDPNCPTCQGNPYWGKTLSSWERCECQKRKAL